ncbi:MAG: bifunctional phosphoribosylaminoimidazolecarboxamide formyltransferase/IMP cyclohydrolase [Candidatus Omnitrophica bacterium]|nr:bifunctional phosphoribosylaminoimidazolecarboxamide formyltransferase/IMP cyclohydrolase [Candidatus Omnitrophota bacterium]
MAKESHGRIRRALVSVSSKEGLIPFVSGLRSLGVRIVSTGGTAKVLKENGIPVQEVSDFTGFPEILAGRVKTLHPRVHGSILASRRDKSHLAQVRRLGLELIDLVVVNLYPFEETAGRRSAKLEDLIEQIDIGGVALIRSAAKNFQSVGIVSRPAQYQEVLEELRRRGGCLSQKTRCRLAVEAFSETAYYDAVIQQALSHRLRGATTWPERLVFAASRRQVLRYGENPHQEGSWYQWPSVSRGFNGLATARQLHGRELSFNNLLDLDSAIRLVGSFKKPAAVVIKHANPCGAACAPTLKRAFLRAFAGDPMSAFGGIVGLNRRVDAVTAQAVVSAGFLECLVAPAYSPQALKILKTRKNLRVIEKKNAAPSSQCLEIKQIDGGLLVQQPDEIKRPPSAWRLATRRKPTAGQRRDLAFAWIVSQHVRSNAIVIARDEQVVGIGAGQMSRVDSVRLALRKAGQRAQGSVLASDGFFPKPDGPSYAVRAGIRAIVQPGGSIQDPAVIRVADRAGVPMLLTGERHFKH